jgi:hypothetical protein
MSKTISRSRASLWLLSAAWVGVAEAQDARLSLFERYNHARTYEDIKPLVSGTLAQQYAFVASHDAQQLQQLMAQQQLTSYRSRIVNIDNRTSFLAQVSGMTVSEHALVGSHFNDRKTAVCRLILKIDKANHLSLLNVGFDDHQGAVMRSKLWQPSKADVSTLTLEGDKIDLVTAGTFGTEKDGIRWNLKIKLPIWEKGL